MPPIPTDLSVKFPEYEIEFVASIRTSNVTPMIRGRSGPTREALLNAVDYLKAHAADMLCGNWSCRAELEAKVRDNIRLLRNES